jgi:DNA repair exonuclease SbcCD ATPase subunit
LLDQLAEHFGHTAAGEGLKAARDQSRRMVEQGQAAACDYVETNRRDTAIRFVIDAFNGRADAILTRTKSDNFGTLEQEIRDAFGIVNLNGQAFRNARILPSYLEARLAELKWAVVVQELREKERDEQRRIAEQIREEEKARRDYERAIREAARDEERLRQAMETVQRQVREATETQKAKYEQQLQDLAAKLKEAEEKNQRALSMAQQTRRGHVYIISNVGSFGEHTYKIGLTRRLEPLDRIRELGDSSVPFEFDVHAMIFSEDAPALEARLHRHFVEAQVNKINPRKEFFRVDLGHIRDQIEKLGLAASWTMVAAAAEYRESLALEKAMMENPAVRRTWIQRQWEFDPAEGNMETEDTAGSSMGPSAECSQA